MRCPKSCSKNKVPKVFNDFRDFKDYLMLFTLPIPFCRQ